MSIIIILAITLLIAVVGLGFQIGIASWNIRRANRYRRENQFLESKVNCLEKVIERKNERNEALMEYSSKLFWLVNFLYKRYDSFSDLEKEFNEGLQPNDASESVVDLDSKYQDLKKAVKVIRTTAKATAKLDSATSMIHEVIEDLIEDDEDSTEDASSEIAENSEDKES